MSFLKTRRDMVKAGSKCDCVSPMNSRSFYEKDKIYFLHETTQPSSQIRKLFSFEDKFLYQPDSLVSFTFGSPNFILPGFFLIIQSYSNFPSTLRCLLFYNTKNVKVATCITASWPASHLFTMFSIQVLLDLFKQVQQTSIKTKQWDLIP